MTAKTNAQKQSDWRRRQKEAGLTEVRGIYAKPELHDKIRAYARSLDETQKPAR